MNTKTKAVLAAVALAVAFASGRYLTPTKVVTEIKTVEVEKKTSESDKNKHKETTIIEVAKPDGTKETTTKTVEDTDSKKSTTDETAKSSDQTKEVTREGSRLSISALAGTDVTNWAAGPIYGAHVSKDLLGPISIGVWGLTNKTGGISIGLSL